MKWFSVQFGPVRITNHVLVASCFPSLHCLTSHLVNLQSAIHSCQSFVEYLVLCQNAVWWRIPLTECACFLSPEAEQQLQRFNHHQHQLQQRQHLSDSSDSSDSISATASQRQQRQQRQQWQHLSDSHHSHHCSLTAPVTSLCHWHTLCRKLSN